MSKFVTIMMLFWIEEIKYVVQIQIPKNPETKKFNPQKNPMLDF